MKVLFAIGDDKTSKIIADKYYEKYGEVLEYKNVFYFKALLEEVKRDKTYQRIVISEELEQFSTTNYDAVDQFLFTKIDNITDEIQDADIIIICSERRTKSDRLLSRLFAIGIYNMLIGEDRDFDPLCRIIKKPKTKREAKLYLNLDPTLEAGNFSTRNDEVDETQLINIINYYEKLGNDEEKYVQAFDNIAEQYSREQLKVIISSLKPKVRDVIKGVEKYSFLFDEPKVDQAKENEQKEKNNKKTSFFGEFKLIKKSKDERIAKEKAEKEKREKEEQERIAKEKEEKGRLAREVEEQERLAREKVEQDRLAREKEEQERIAKEQTEQDRIEREKAEQERLARQLVEQQRKAIEKVEQERIEREKAEQERFANERAEQERLAREQEENARIEKERRDQEKLAAEKAEQERIAREKAEQERIAAEKTEKERIAAEKTEQERIAAEKTEQEKVEIEQIVQEEHVEKAEQESIKSEIVEQERLAAENAEQERLAREKTEQERIAAEKVEQERIAREKVEQERVAREKSEQERVAREKAEHERLAREKSEQERVAREKAEQERIAREKSEQERLAREKAEQARLAREKSEQERLAREKAEQERFAREKAEQERLAREKAEQDRLAAEKAEQERLAKVQKQPTVIDNIDEYKPVFELPRGYKKVVVFVGSNKSGTTFMANAVAYATAKKGIQTALVDLTRDRGIYYIHTQNNEKLRKIASTCMQNLYNGVDSPIQSSKNLNVYTAMPGAIGEDRRTYKHKALLDTLKQRNSLVILDCDFTTPFDYFEIASEIYIIQDMDVLKMQDATMFLRELKNRKTDMRKIRVIINKYVKTSLTPKTIIEEGLSYYNDPAMSFVDTLLPGKVLYSVVPYDLENYKKYIEILYSANGLDYSGFTQEFLNAIEDVAQHVYPVENKDVPKKRRGLFG